MRAQALAYNRFAGLSAAGRAIPLTALIGFLLAATPVHADPMLLETAVTGGSVWPVLAAGLVVEILVLALFIRRPLAEIIAVGLMANAISGFAGFVALLFARMNGVPVLPIGPLALGAAVIEAAVFACMLAKPPVKRILSGVAVANAVSAIIAFALVAPTVIPAPPPSASDDLELARGLATVRNAIDEYYVRNGYYPEGLTGGRSGTVEGESGSSDPLITSGVLSSYPPNPYAPHLRSRLFNPMFLLTGFGAPTRLVALDQPTSSWEVRWFPILKRDSRFGDPDHVLLCANGLSDPSVRETVKSTFYHMNGSDCVPGCFFYKSYDFDRDGLADDYILGAYGWPTGTGTVAFDIIDAATGDISLRLDSHGQVHSGQPDGSPEPVFALHIAGGPASKN